VIGDQRSKLQGGRGQGGSRLAVVIACERALQLNARGGDGTKVRGASGLEILTDGPVIGDKLFQYCVRPSGEGLALALHPADCFGGLASSLRGQTMTDEN